MVATEMLMVQDGRRWSLQRSWVAPQIAGILRMKVCPAAFDEAPSSQRVPPSDFPKGLTWLSWN